MFCEKCGKPLEGEQTLCNECAALENAADVVEAPAAEAVQEDTFQLATADEVPVKKKKKKGGLIAGIVAAAVVVAAGVGVALGWDSVSAFWDRTFKSPEDYFADVERSAITQYTDEFTASYGMLLKSRATAVGAAKAEVALTVGDDILTMLESTLQQQGAQIDLDWLKEIKLSMDANMQENAMHSAIGFGLGDNKLLSLDVFMDMASGKGYLAIPELSKDYFLADMAAAGFSGTTFQDILNNSAKLQNDLIKDLPSEEAMNKMLNKYVDIVLSQITNVERDSDTVEIDGVSQKMTVLTAKIKAKDMIKIAEKVLEKAQKDKTLEQLITAYGNYMNETAQLYGSSQAVDLYQEFVNDIPSALEALEEAEENVDSGNYVKLKAYVDMQGTVRGHELVVYTDGKKDDTTISYLTVAKGNTIYTEAEIAEVEITGEKTVVDGVSDGEYTLTVEDEEIGTLKFEDLTGQSGTLLLVPGESFIQGFASGSGIPASLLTGNVALELVFDGSASQAACEMNILVGKKTLLGLAFSNKEVAGGDITLPTSALNPANQQDLLTWLKGVNFENVFSAMEKANVPADLINLAKSYTSKLQYFTNPTEVTLDQYQAMSYEEQVFFQNCFADSDAFAAWYWDAYDAYYFG